MKKWIVILLVVFVTILSGKVLVSQYRNARVEKFLSEKRTELKKHESRLENFLKKQKELLAWQDAEFEKIEKMLADIKAKMDVISAKTADFLSKTQEKDFLVREAFQRANEEGDWYAQEKIIPELKKIRESYRNAIFNDRSEEEMAARMPELINGCFEALEPFYAKVGEAMMAEVEYNLEQQKQYLALLKELTGIDFLEWKKSQGL
jgi:hypothetical protein